MPPLTARASLPIDAALPALLSALETGRNAVLQAPPGAGKTTRAPLALYEKAAWRGDGRIVMLQPRRVAARAAAERIAESLGEPVGRTVGYRIRSEAKASAATRIEVVTEGILTRRLQSDPELSGVAAVLFDEIHERSIHADLGLALCLEIQSALRPDLRLAAMSATLDETGLAALMNAAVIRSEGRSFAVETVWRAAPLGKEDRVRGRFERVVAQTTAEALAAQPGDALVFLPGAAEIHRTGEALARLAPDAAILPLYSALPAAAQRQAIAPSEPNGPRKIVLATTIAETSLTIDGVRIVVDAGRARRARFDPAVGMDRLVTEPVSRAAAAQRRGRAGRTAPGVCWRLWSKGEEGALPAFDPPEILQTDLAPLALELAAWGARPADLAFLDPPPDAAYAQARALLQAIGALDASGRITDHGRRLATAPAHPRTAHMLFRAGAGAEASRLAALLEAGDPLRDEGADLTVRLAALREPKRRPGARAALERVAADASRLRARLASDADPPPRTPLSIGAMAALAYPERVAQRRPGQTADPTARKPVAYLTAQGRAAEIAPQDPLAKSPYLAIAELWFPQSAGKAAGDPQIRLAAPIAESEIRALFEERIEPVESVTWSRRENAVAALREERLGAIALASARWRGAPEDAVAAAMLEGIRRLGLDALPWTAAADRLRARVAAARASGDPGALRLPDFSDDALLGGLETWLGPYLSGVTRKADLARLDLAQALSAQLDHAATQMLDRLLPKSFRAPGGQGAPIDYSGDQPKIRIRLQALFGVTRHPIVGGRPLLIELLSPADRPIQLTADLPGFWAGSYADVRKDMRARYPKHAWPEDPAAATPPTRPAKR